ncbi:hypothetical protein KIL84_021839 [Mauremys mutica]|uniref:Uncharacterized protein n=1 Tax=Mauremys mutica TaxID=74926 RepID=A0A9D3XGL5_9SAUR|nr:hypothetical protein KIL84_021839 [Mauremys mutica]
MCLSVPPSSLTSCAKAEGSSMQDPPPPPHYFPAVYSLPLITFSEIDWLPPAGGYEAFSCSWGCVHKLPEGEKLNGTCAMQHPLCEKVGLVLPPCCCSVDVKHAWMRQVEGC